jgi:hypothetical protein
MVGIRMSIDITWLNISEIILLLSACWACYFRGRVNGVHSVIELFLEEKIITPRDLEKLKDY